MQFRAQGVRFSRRSISRRRALMAAALLATGSSAAHAANLTNTWLAAVNGTWTDATKWSLALSPNNAADTYTVIIGATSSAYTTTLNSTVTINDLSLTSANATLDLNGGTLSVLNSMINVSAGTFLFSGGMLNGGSIGASGSGTIAFASSGGSRLANNAVLVGDLALALNNGRVRLQSGATFSGAQATLSGSSNTLGFEYTTTLAGKTVNLNGTGGQVSLEGSNTITIGATSVVRGRGSVGQAAIFGGTSGIVNNGRISADIASSILTINPPNLLNTGTMEATGGSTLNVNAASFSNSGTIIANGAVSPSTVNAGVFNGTWSNSGLLSATNSATLTTDGTWTNTGSISINNARLNLDGNFTTGSVVGSRLVRSGGTITITGTLDNTGTVLALSTSTGDWNINGGAISGGSITTTSGGSLLFGSNSSNRLTNGAVYIGDMVLNQPTGRLRLQSGATFSGSNATLSSSSNLLAFEQSTSITGKTFNLDGTGPSVSIEGTNTLTIDSTSTVRGRGNLGAAAIVGGTGMLINNGLITADISANTFSVNPNILINNGTMQATAGGRLGITSGSFTNNGAIQNSSSISSITVGQFNGSWTNSASGLITVSGGGTLTTDGTWTNLGSISMNAGLLILDGTFTTANVVPGRLGRTGGTVNLTGNLNNTGTVLALSGSTGDWVMLGGGISGGSITTAAGGSLIFGNNSGNRLMNNASYTGDLILDTTGGKVRLQSGGTFSGSSATLSSSNNVLAIEQVTTLSGKTINLAGTTNILSIEGSNTLTIAATSLVRGRGSVGVAAFLGGTSGIINDGRISADIAGAGNALAVNPLNLQNNGTIEAVNGATLNVSSGSFTNAGTIVGNGAVAASAANVGLFNSNWTNSATGLLTAINNGTLSTDGTWTNAGVISVNNAFLELGGTFTTSSVVGARLARSGGTVALAGFLENTGTVLALSGSTGDWLMRGGGVNGGSITNSAGGSLRFGNAAANRLMSNAVLLGDLIMDQPSGRLRLQSGGTWSGSAATFSSANNALAFEYATTLVGKTINMDGGGIFGIEAANTLTIAPSSVIRGRGSIGQAVFVSGNSTLINNGRISADMSSGGISLNPVSLVNNGTIEATNGGSLSILVTSGSFTSNGTLAATAAGRLFAGSLNGSLGSVRVDGLNSLVRLNGTYTINQPIAVTNRATLNLLGAWTKSADINASGRIGFDYPTAGPSPYTTLRSQIVAGRNSGLWNGPGINSTAAAGNALTGVGYAESSAAIGTSGGAFGGDNVDGTSVLVRWTYLGDTDVDGDVDIADLGNLASNWQTTGDWIDGDFDYNGTINVNDLGLLATNWQAGVGNPLGPSLEEALSTLGLPTSVPEPAATSLLVGLTFLAATPRWRKRAATPLAPSRSKFAR